MGLTCFQTRELPAKQETLNEERNSSYRDVYDKLAELPSSVYPEPPLPFSTGYLSSCSSNGQTISTTASVTANSATSSAANRSIVDAEAARVDHGGGAAGAEGDSLKKSVCHLQVPGNSSRRSSEDSQISHNIQMSPTWKAMEKYWFLVVVVSISLLVVGILANLIGYDVIHTTRNYPNWFHNICRSIGLVLLFFCLAIVIICLVVCRLWRVELRRKIMARELRERVYLHAIVMDILNLPEVEPDLLSDANRRRRLLKRYRKSQYNRSDSPCFRENNELKAKGKMPGIQISHFETFDEDTDLALNTDESKDCDSYASDVTREYKSTIFETMPKVPSKKNSQYQPQSCSNSKSTNCDTKSSHDRVYRLPRSRGHSKFIINGPKNETEVEREKRIGQQQVYNDLLDIDNETTTDEEQEVSGVERHFGNHLTDSYYDPDLDGLRGGEGAGGGDEEEDDLLLNREQPRTGNHFNDYPVTSKSLAINSRRSEANDRCSQSQYDSQRNAARTGGKTTVKLTNNTATTTTTVSDPAAKERPSSTHYVIVQGDLQADKSQLSCGVSEISLTSRPFSHSRSRSGSRTESWVSSIVSSAFSFVSDWSIRDSEFDTDISMRSGEIHISQESNLDRVKFHLEGSKTGNGWKATRHSVDFTSIATNDHKNNSNIPSPCKTSIIQIDVDHDIIKQSKCNDTLLKGSRIWEFKGNVDEKMMKNKDKCQRANDEQQMSNTWNLARHFKRASAVGDDIQMNKPQKYSKNRSDSMDHMEYYKPAKERIYESQLPSKRNTFTRHEDYYRSSDQHQGCSNVYHKRSHNTSAGVSESRDMTYGSPLEHVLQEQVVASSSSYGLGSSPVAHVHEPVRAGAHCVHSELYRYPANASSRGVYPKCKSTTAMKNKQRNLPSMPVQKLNSSADNLVESRHTSANHTHRGHGGRVRSKHLTGE